MESLLAIFVVLRVRVILFRMATHDLVMKHPGFDVGALAAHQVRTKCMNQDFIVS